MRKPDFTTPSKEQGYLLFNEVDELRTIIIDEIALKMTPEFADHLEYLGVKPCEAVKGFDGGDAVFKKDEQIIYKPKAGSTKRSVPILIPSSDYDMEPRQCVVNEHVFQCQYQTGFSHDSNKPIRRVHLHTFDTAILKAIWVLIGEFGWEGS